MHTGALFYRLPQGKWATSCIFCRTPVEICSNKTARACGPCFFEARKANTKVGAAIAKGVLPRAKTQKCVDCGRDASCWDHRDYDAPLEVEAVCSSCNRKRGPAKFASRLSKALRGSSE